MDSDGVSWLRGPILGKGAFGSVFLATLRHPKSRTKTSFFPPKMAVKSAEFSASGSLQKEKEILSNLRGCPCVVQCLGEETTFGRNGEMAYNVLLEYASGGTLADSIKKSNGVGLPEREVRRYTRCVLEGLCHVHDCGYVHCDLKPDNILLVPGKRGGGFVAKLGDFGLAKRGRQSKRHKLLLSSYLRGTTMYLAPETVVDHVQEFPSDVWSLGCVVLEMLTGKKPWNFKQNINSKQVLDMISNENALPEIPSWISREGRDFLKGCLVRKPGMRWSTDIMLNHPFVQGLDAAEFEEASDGTSEESLSYDSEFSSEYSSSISEEDEEEEEEGFVCVADTVEDDGLFEALTQASSSPTMEEDGLFQALTQASSIPTMEEDGLFQAPTPASSRPTMHEPSVIVIPADA
ncbi:hypothetical protein ACOSQ2_006958 [Xanthoceras sorbifolium]|uniref:Protein kinase domain-containing protein n=1 Tax=Xanthoceras sorbifolium TaxID=99658 RepID=A0ABQ8I981_9ROSI|nr:hypothetical protein JRO89_XS03G0087500 [Xanthoceras sorbifolium]